MSSCLYRVLPHYNREWFPSLKNERKLLIIFSDVKNSSYEDIIKGTEKYQEMFPNYRVFIMDNRYDISGSEEINKEYEVLRVEKIN